MSSPSPKDLLSTFKNRLFQSKLIEYYRHLGEDANLPAVDSNPAREFAKLREALSGRDELLSIVTHELKTPLTSMKLMLQLLDRLTRNRESIPCEEVTRMVKPAQRQVDRLTKLVENLLDLSRIQNNNRLDLDIEKMDLTETLREVANRMKSQAEWTGSVIHVDDTGPVVGSWDRLRLEQIVTNLVTNAIKYGSGKPIILSAKINRRMAEIKVEDHGIGISQSDQQRIFVQFERAPAPHQIQSLGLGLYIVQEIVKAHGGTISLESELNRGSIFTIRLPLEVEIKGLLQ